MDFTALFRPRIKNTLNQRLRWLQSRLADGPAEIEVSEVIKELGHPMSPHGIALRQLIVAEGNNSKRKLYRLNRAALAELMILLRDMEVKRNEDVEFTTNLQKEHIDLVMRVDAAEERINDILHSSETVPTSFYYTAVADAAILTQSLKAVRSAIRINHQSGRQIAERELARYSNIMLSSGEPVLSLSTKPMLQLELVSSEAVEAAHVGSSEEAKFDEHA